MNTVVVYEYKISQFSIFITTILLHGRNCTLAKCMLFRLRYVFMMYKDAKDLDKVYAHARMHVVSDVVKRRAVKITFDVF